MGIRLLYGLKTTDQGYLDVFYPSRRLKEEARKANLDYQALIVPAKMETGGITEFCRGHVVVLRGEMDTDYYATLLEMGCRIINPLQAVLLARDKLESAHFFRKEGFSHPKTVAMIRGGEPPMEFPFIVKPRFGKMGIGVALIKDAEEYRAYGHPGDILAQEYVRESTGRDVRFFFASFSERDKKFINRHPRMPGTASACVRRESGGLLSNVHSGAITYPFEPCEKLLSAAEAIFERSGLVYGTVDFLFGKDDTFPVCEINSCPGFEGLETATGINAAAAILETADRMERY